VFRLGLSASYRPGERTVERALDDGVDYCFCYGFDGQMTRVLSRLNADRRERVMIATGAYNLLWGHPNLERTLEKRLRQLKTDYIDVFHFLGVTKEKHFPPRLRDELRRLKETGRVRAVSASIHARAFAGRLARDGELDALMIRYNAAHLGAERDIFPHLAAHRPGVVSYTATRWRFLLRRPRGWEGAVPGAGHCYRFVLTNPHVDVVLTAPRSEKEFAANLEAVRCGPLDEEEMKWMRAFGDRVHATAGWFW
jgi:aryl-alcohol dehydrogenase-like predicted oxidoreductase